MNSSPKTSAIKPGGTFFVTGASGFVGRYVIRELVAKGHRVRGLTRTEAGAAAVHAAGGIPVLGDLQNEKAMKAGITGASGVVHAAAYVAMHGPWEDFVKDTVEGTRHTIELAKANGVKRFVHVSTEAVLAEGEPIVEAEETAPIPKHHVGPYPRSKAMSEEIAKAASDGAFETVIVRPRFIWGVGDFTLLPGLIATMEQGQWAWFNGGHHKTSTCHVKNVAHGIYLAACYGAPGEVYFLTDGPPVEFRQFVTRLVGTQGLKAPDREAPLLMGEALALAFERAWKIFKRADHPPLTRTLVNLMFKEVTVKNDKAKRELGYEPIVTIDEGMNELQQSADDARRELASST